MVLYYVEIDDSVTGTKLYNKVQKKQNMFYEGILNDYKTSRNKRLALFIVEDDSILEFKVMFPISTTLMPDGVPDEVSEFYDKC